MVKKIQFDVTDEELAAMEIHRDQIHAGKPWRDVVLASLGIKSAARKIGRPSTKALTKTEERALKLLKRAYYEVIDELEAKDDGFVQSVMKLCHDDGLPRRKDNEIVAVLKEGRKSLFAGLRAYIDKMSMADVKAFEKEVVKTILTPPKLPTPEEAYEAMTKSGRNLYKEYEDELLKHKARVRKMKKAPDTPVEKPPFDMDLRLKAREMAGPARGSYENVLRKLHAEKKAEA